MVPGALSEMRLGLHAACGPDRAARPCRLLDHLVGAGRHPTFAERALRNIGQNSDHSGLMPANFTTLPHFSVSSAMSLPKSADEPASTVPPRSISRALTLVSARPALISLLSLSMISTGVPAGAPTPNQALAS